MHTGFFYSLYTMAMHDQLGDVHSMYELIRDQVKEFELDARHTDATIIVNKLKCDKRIIWAHIRDDQKKQKGAEFSTKNWKPTQNCRSVSLFVFPIQLYHNVHSSDIILIRSYLTPGRFPQLKEKQKASREQLEVTKLAEREALRHSNDVNEDVVVANVRREVQKRWRPEWVSRRAVVACPSL